MPSGRPSVCSGKCPLPFGAPFPSTGVGHGPLFWSSSSRNPSILSEFSSTPTVGRRTHSPCSPGTTSAYPSAGPWRIPPIAGPVALPVRPSPAISSSKPILPTWRRPWPISPNPPNFLPRPPSGQTFSPCPFPLLLPGPQPLFSASFHERPATTQFLAFSLIFRMAKLSGKTRIFQWLENFRGPVRACLSVERGITSASRNTP